jgi:hypothetical protein
MELRTDCIYLCSDNTNGVTYLLLPKDCQLDIVDLRLDDPDSRCTDRAEFTLLREEMQEHRYDI